jgi:hypothetical protein
MGIRPARRTVTARRTPGRRIVTATTTSLIDSTLTRRVLARSIQSARSIQPASGARPRRASPGRPASGRRYPRRGGGRHRAAAGHRGPGPELIPAWRAGGAHRRPDAGYPQTRLVEAAPPAPAEAPGTAPPPAPAAALGTAPAPGTAPAGVPPALAQAKLDQIKDLYVTAAAIGEDALVKHFEEVSRRQRDLIREYFEQTGFGAGARPGSWAPSQCPVRRG